MTSKGQSAKTDDADTPIAVQRAKKTVRQYVQKKDDYFEGDDSVEDQISEDDNEDDVYVPVKESEDTDSPPPKKKYTRTKKKNPKIKPEEQDDDDGTEEKETLARKTKSKQEGEKDRIRAHRWKINEIVTLGNGVEKYKEALFDNFRGASGGKDSRNIAWRKVRSE